MPTAARAARVPTAEASELTAHARRFKSLVLNLLKAKLPLARPALVAHVLRALLSLLAEPTASVLLLDARLRFHGYHEIESRGKSVEQLTDEFMRVVLDIRPKAHYAILVFGRVVPTLLYTPQVQASLQEEGVTVPAEPEAAAAAWLQELSEELPEEELTAEEQALEGELRTALHGVKVDWVDTYLVNGYSVLSTEQRRQAAERAQEIEMYRLQLQHAARAVQIAADTETPLPDEVAELLEEFMLPADAPAPVAPVSAEALPATAASADAPAQLPAAASATEAVRETTPAAATDRLTHVDSFSDLDKLFVGESAAGAPASVSPSTEKIAQAKSA